MLAKAVPGVVSIATRRIQQDQFNEPMPRSGLGSGVIVDARGYILTNNHVVEGADAIKVTLPDERTFRAVLVGADPFTDLAVLKIEGKRLPVLPLGDSARMRVGETAINPGNSGGPLLNLAGQVVGINVSLIPSAHGIGFAISVNTARPVLKALIATGRIIRPSLVLTAVSVTPQLAFVNDLPVERGALVRRVEPEGPADVAGIKPGDVITAVGDRPVKDLHDLHDRFIHHSPGEPIEVTLQRDGQTFKLRPVLQESK